MIIIVDVAYLLLLLGNVTSVDSDSDDQTSAHPEGSKFVRIATVIMLIIQHRVYHQNLDHNFGYSNNF